MIHAQLPGTVEAYYQEAGRQVEEMACRPSACSLHSPGDLAIHEFFNRQLIESMMPEKREAWEKFRNDQLELMRRYAYGAGCRQQAIMDYFGDADTLPKGCGQSITGSYTRAPPVGRDPGDSPDRALGGRASGRAIRRRPPDRSGHGERLGATALLNHQNLPTFGRLPRCPSACRR